MDCIDRLCDLSNCVGRELDKIGEESTKAAFVLPLLRALDYDVFNPDEVISELAADPITEPRSEEKCSSESSRVINSASVRCRRGWQELTRFDAAGYRVVLSERRCWSSDSA